MANYKNLFPTIFKGKENKIYPADHTFTTAELNVEQAKQYMVLEEIGADGKKQGSEIKIQPNEFINVA